MIREKIRWLTILFSAHHSHVLCSWLEAHLMGRGGGGRERKGEREGEKRRKR